MRNFLPNETLARGITPSSLIDAHTCSPKLLCAKKLAHDLGLTNQKYLLWTLNWKLLIHSCRDTNDSCFKETRMGSSESSKNRIQWPWHQWSTSSTQQGKYSWNLAVVSSQDQFYGMFIGCGSGWEVFLCFLPISSLPNNSVSSPISSMNFFFCLSYPWRFLLLTTRKSDWHT